MPGQHALMLIRIFTNMLPQLLVCLGCLHPNFAIAQQRDSIDLVDYVAIALSESDQVIDLADQRTLAALDVTVAANRFRPKLVPLANYGIASGTASQTLGMEVRSTLTGGSNITLGTYGSRLEDDDYAVANSHQLRTYVKVSQPLFRRWGERYNRYALTRAEKLSHKQILLNEQSRQDIIQAAIQRFYAVLLGRNQLRLAKTALERSQRYHAAAIDRQQVGLVSKTDVYRAELAVLRTEMNVLEQTRSLESAEEALLEFISRPAPDELANAIDENIHDFQPVLPEDWKTILPAQRPEWQAHLIEQDLLRHARYRAERDLLPDVSVNLQYEHKGLGNSFDEARSLDENSWSVQLQLHSPFDTTEEQAALARTRMTQARLIRDGKSLERRIAREARQALTNLSATEQRLGLSHKTLEQAGKALDLALVRYERGLSDNIDLLDAETAYASAQSDIIAQRVAYNLEATRLARALGVLSLEWLQLSANPDDPHNAQIESGAADESHPTRDLAL